MSTSYFSYLVNLTLYDNRVNVTYLEKVFSVKEFIQDYLDNL